MDEWADETEEEPQLDRWEDLARTFGGPKIQPTSRRLDHFEPRFLNIVMRYDCKHACEHCIFSCNPHSRGVLPQEMVREAITYAASHKFQTVGLSGGEPMLDPEAVYDALSLASKLGLRTALQSAFVGEVQQLEERARRLREADLGELTTSLSTYHQQTSPVGADQYLDHLLDTLDAFAREEIESAVKLSWDDENEDLTRGLLQQFLAKLQERGGRFESFSFPAMHENYELKDSRITIYNPTQTPIIAIGSARKAGLRSPHAANGNLYACPLYRNGSYSVDMLSIYPDGRVGRCCSSQRGADFGFGNVYTHSLDTILRNIRESRVINSDFPHLLIQAHEMLEEEFPDYLPAGGARQACEICSATMCRQETRDRLAARSYDFSRFTPANQADRSPEQA